MNERSIRPCAVRGKRAWAEAAAAASHRHGRHRSLVRRRGMVLIVVLAALALAGALLAIVGSGLRQQLMRARHAADEQLLAQVADSARAWATAHPEFWSEASGVTLEPQAILPADTQGAVKLIPVAAQDAVRRLRVEVTLKLERRTIRRSWDYLQPGAPQPAASIPDKPE